MARRQGLEVQRQEARCKPRLMHDFTVSLTADCSQIGTTLSSTEGGFLG